MDWKKLLTFDEMIAPKIITILYWLMLAAVIIQSLGIMFSGGIGGSSYGGGPSLGAVGAFFAGLLALVMGAIMVRVWCELLIVLFKMYENLKAIREKLEQS